LVIIDGLDGLADWDPAADLFLGAAVAQVNAFDAPALERALQASGAEVVIDELTACPGTRRKCPSFGSAQTCVLARCHRLIPG